MRTIAFLAVWWFVCWQVSKMLDPMKSKCPRERMMYSCRGEGCDHSEETMRKTMELIEKNNRRDF